MRQYKLAQLYSKCKDNGCLNPIDEKQIMMVKVFAMDLHLNFKNVDSLLKEAEIAYNKTQEELEQSRINAEKAAAIKNSEGIKLFTAKDNKTTLNVYRRVDGTLYALVNNDENRIYNISVKIFHGGVTYYKYVPSKTIYTGATVGGISTGGFHQTQDGYEAAKDKSDKGYFEINYGDNTITPKKVIVDDKIANLLKRDKDFTRYFKSKNSATCYNIYYDNSDDLQILAHITDQAAKMTFLSEMVDKGRLSYVDSKGIYNVIDRILRGSFPPPDEQIYNQALSLVHSNTTNEIKKGMDLLLSISDYKDSSQILEQARTKHKEILWKEKENKVIKKEKKAKKRKKCLIALIIIAITCIAAIIIVPKALYGSAQTAINEKDYDKANLLFTLLGDYQDSPEMLNETTYQNAKSLQDNKQYEEAFKLFDSLENYKDSIYQADISCYKLAEQFKESGNTEKAIETLDWSTFISDDELYNKVQKEKTQLRYDYILGHK
ncbi:MAG: hypothetical protein J6R20_07030, partial [Clostridia bacterium]|nr:hypothetical protein [Clostridia bacterium]